MQSTHEEHFIPPSINEMMQDLLIKQTTISADDTLHALRGIAALIAGTKTNPSFFHAESAISDLVYLLNHDTNIQIKRKTLQIIFQLINGNYKNFNALIKNNIALPILYNVSNYMPNTIIHEAAYTILRYYWLQVIPKNPKVLSFRRTETQTVTVAKPFHLGIPVNYIRPTEVVTRTDALLGTGSFGAVYKGTYRNQCVAVKRYENLSKLSIHQSFFEEAYLHGQLNHPHIVSMLGVCVEPNHYFLALEFMENGDLYRLLRNQKHLMLQEKIKIAINIMEGLAYLHEQKVIHCDLKSPNILLNHAMQAKISDFGASLVMPETNTLLEIYIGTIQWRAPELFDEKTPPSFSSDIYSAGVILWELMTQRKPHQHLETEEKVKDFVCSGQREKIRSNTPKKYAELIQQCWDQNPENRPRNPLAAKVVLNECLDKIERKATKRKLGSDEALSSSKHHCFFQAAQSPSFSLGQLDTFPIENLISEPNGVLLNG